MALGDFVWCDLSTFRPDITKRFYTKLFGWSYEAMSQPDGSLYELASTDFGPSAALYQMPPKFVDLGMPSFWMPYIEVEDIQSVCDTAISIGGIVEIGPIDWGESGKVALIRDPLGAGFTVMQDGLPGETAIASRSGHAMAFALYVSDASAVSGFYNTLFGWTVKAQQTSTESFSFISKQGHPVADLHQLPDEERGKEQFWSIQFAVENLDASKAILLAEGGEVVFESPDTLLARDPDGGAFLLTQSQTPDAPPKTVSRSSSSSKWRTWLGLAAIYLALFSGLNWIWGFLFLLWSIPALRSGETHFVEPISRRETPGLYWVLVGTWIGLSLLLFWYGWSP